MGNYYVYILCSVNNNVLYVGVTNNLMRRTSEHNIGTFEGFTKKYKVHKLVYYEVFTNVTDAIAREKQLKGWRRSKKIDLINSFNPYWNDLF